PIRSGPNIGSVSLLEERRSKRLRQRRVLRLAASLHCTVFARVLILLVILSPSKLIAPAMVRVMRAAATAYSDSSNPVSSFRNLLSNAISPLFVRKWSGFVLACMTQQAPTYHFVCRYSLTRACLTARCSQAS